MLNPEIETYCPASRKEWRSWLRKNHASKRSIWLVYYKKGSGSPTVTYSEAVEEALCFGWIDSTKKTMDAERFMQFFCKRKPNSVWSKINKVKVQRLIDEKLMAPAGLESIEKAKQNKSWSILDDVEELVIPKDLAKEFKSSPGSKEYFLSLSPSSRKMMLQWLVLAKRPETRQNRVEVIVENASQKMKPKQFR